MAARELPDVLVSRALDGDRAAAEQLFTRAYRFGLRYAWQWTRNRADAQDALQAACLLAWRELPRLSDPRGFFAWFRTILRNDIIATAARRRRFVALETLNRQALARAAYSIERDIIARDQARALA